METFAPASSSRHTRIRITTHSPTQFIDLTTHLERFIADARIRAGVVNVQTLHTTTGIVVNEHEPLLLADFAALLENSAPANICYRHDDPTVRTGNPLSDGRINGHSHCRALLLGPSVCLNVIDGRLQLGRWQRVFLAELDGPREREVSVLILGEGA